MRRGFRTRSWDVFPDPRAEFVGGASNVVWGAAHNQFFAIVAMPQQPAQQFVARKVDLPRPTGEEASLVATNAAAPVGYEVAIVYPASALGPNQATDRQIFRIYRPKGVSDAGQNCGSVWE